jgi:hypothetical protein
MRSGVPIMKDLPSVCLNNCLYEGVRSSYTEVFMWHLRPGLNRTDKNIHTNKLKLLFGKLISKNSEVKRAWFRAFSGWVTDQEEQCRTSEDKVCRKDLCWSVMVFLISKRAARCTLTWLWEAGHYNFWHQLSVNIHWVWILKDIGIGC